MSDSDGYKLLAEVFEICKSENVFDSVEGKPIIYFKDPLDLLKEIDFNLHNKNSQTLDKVRKIVRSVIRNSVKTNNPNFYFTLSHGYDPYGLAASWILDALNTLTVTYDMSPAFTLMENATIDKFLDLFDMAGGEGLFTPGGSIANMCGIQMARHRISPMAKEHGMYNEPQLIGFTSKDSHFSVTKGFIWLGFGKRNLVQVETDQRGKMCVKALEREILVAIRAGKKPFFVNATAGTTVLGAYDDLQAIGELCRKYDLWFHIDASFGGQAIASHTHKHLLKGCSAADSIAYCPQKIGGAPLQSAVCLFKRKGSLEECNALKATYIFQQDKWYDVAYDIGDKGMLGSKKGDCFKVWLMYKARGDSGIEKATDLPWYCAGYLADQLRIREGFRLVLDQFECTNVCVWYIPPSMRGLVEDEEWWGRIFKVTLAIVERMIRKGHFMVAYSSFPEKGWGNFFRLTVVSYPPPSEESMDAVMEEIEAFGKDL